MNTVNVVNPDNLRQVASMLKDYTDSKCAPGGGGGSSPWFAMEIRGDDLWVIFSDSTTSSPLHINSAGELILTI